MPVTRVDTAFVHDGSPYGTRVDDDFFRIVYAPEGGEVSVLATWSEDEQEDEFGAASA